MLSTDFKHKKSQNSKITNRVLRNTSEPTAFKKTESVKKKMNTFILKIKTEKLTKYIIKIKQLGKWDIRFILCMLITAYET